MPDVEIDWTPVLTIPYTRNLPADLCVWEHQESWLLDQDTRDNIKQSQLIIVAKSMIRDGNAEKVWRVSLDSAPVMNKIVKYFENSEPRCNVKKVLRIIKDLKNVALEGKEKNYLNRNQCILC